MKAIIMTIAFLCTVTASSVSAQIAAGGAFSLEKSAAAAGGAASANGAFSLAGTNGQAGAGTTSTGAAFAHAAGFWIPDQLAPTAAIVSVGGRVVTAGGAGIRSVIVILTDSTGRTRTTPSGSFGYYRFNDVAVGETYILSVTAKKYIFANPTQIVSVQEKLTDLNFEAAPH